LADGVNYSADVDTTIAPGKYSFDGSTEGDTPGTAGNFEVRERDTTIFQVAQTDDNKLFSRSKIGATAWSAWSEYAPSDPSSSKIIILEGEVHTTSSINFMLTKPSMELRIVSPGGGGGGGNPEPYAQPGGLAGNSGTVVDITFTRTGVSPMTVSGDIGVSGTGGAMYTDGVDGDDASVNIGGTAIVVYGGKGGKKGGIISDITPSIRTEPTINGSTMYVGVKYVTAQGTFIVTGIWHSYSAIPLENTGIGMPGVSPFDSGIYSMPIPGGTSAPSNAIGYSGAGGWSEYGGAGLAGPGGTGGPGSITFYT
jgi:hypothetical protein